MDASPVIDCFCNKAIRMTAPPDGIRRTAIDKTVWVIIRPHRIQSMVMVMVMVGGMA